MLESRRYRLAKWMRWLARVIGLIAATMCLVILIGEAVVEDWEATNQADMIAGILIGVFGAIALAGCIISWWRERLAVILLVLTAIGFGIHISIYAGRNHFIAWLMVGFPYLVAAGLLFYSWRLSRQLRIH
jgi:hypothetical protein